MGNICCDLGEDDSDTGESQNNQSVSRNVVTARPNRNTGTARPNQSTGTARPNQNTETARPNQNTGNVRPNGNFNDLPWTRIQYITPNVDTDARNLNCNVTHNLPSDNTTCGRNPSYNLTYNLPSGNTNASYFQNVPRNKNWTEATPNTNATATNLPQITTKTFKTTAKRHHNTNTRPVHNLTRSVRGQVSNAIHPNATANNLPQITTKTFKRTVKPRHNTKTRPAPIVHSPVPNVIPNFREVQIVTPNKRKVNKNSNKKRVDAINYKIKPISTNINTTPPIPINKNFEMLKDISFFLDFNTFLELCYYGDVVEIFDLQILKPFSEEYQKVETLFFRTNKKRCFRISSIEKVRNPFLMLQYELKKKEYEAKDIPVTEEIMFHGTKKENIDGICTNNFDWRFRGAARGYKFGQGVNFSPIAFYATHYGDPGINRVMIVATVLVGNSCIGTKTMAVPPKDFDTTTNEKGHVCVKYDDNVFYPRYLIHYTALNEENAEEC